MKRWIGFLLWLGLCAFALWNLGGIPFHPDESTQLYTSQDFDWLLHAPLSLAWYPSQPQQLWQQDRRLYYRLMDAPFTRYWLGAGRRLAGLPALPVDWEWPQTWAENQARGALPSAGLLHAGRLAVTLLLPFSMLLIAVLAGAMSGRGPLQGWLAMALLGLNTLVLLHARRAMAEGPLLFTVLLTLWSFLYAGRRPWLVGLCAGLAFCAKQSALLLLPVALLAVSWPEDGARPRWRRLPWAWAQLGAAFLLVGLALNPFLWRHPWAAGEAAWKARQSLTQRQFANAQRLTPGIAPNTTGERLAGLLISLYITPPAFAELSNYTAETAAAEQSYLAAPGHNLLRGLAGGGLLFGLTLGGMLLAGLRLRRARPAQRRVLALWLLASLALFIGLGLAIPLPWQRYTVPLVPFAVLWQSYLLAQAAGRPSDPPPDSQDLRTAHRTSLLEVPPSRGAEKEMGGP